MPTLPANSQFVWKPEFSVGVAALDNQHKRLIASVNTLNEAMTVGRGQDRPL